MNIISMGLFEMKCRSGPVTVLLPLKNVWPRGSIGSSEIKKGADNFGEQPFWAENRVPQPRDVTSRAPELGKTA